MLSMVTFVTDIYVGKPSQGTVLEVGLGERVVLQLTECLRGKHYHIYADNFFTTTHLLETLLSHGLYGCGTTRSSRRGFPETLKSVSLQRGEHAFCQHGNLVASVWMDKKAVTVLSTLAQADVTHTAQRRVTDGSRISVQCPDTVVLYNRYMAGVDKGDQYRQYYCVRTKSRNVYICDLLWEKVPLRQNYNFERLKIAQPGLLGAYSVFSTARNYSLSAIFSCKSDGRAPPFLALTALLQRRKVHNPHPRPRPRKREKCAERIY